jgi:hypothetical protein
LGNFPLYARLRIIVKNGRGNDGTGSYRRGARPKCN